MPRPALARKISARQRSARTHLLLSKFPDFPQMRVLDLGGRLRSWENMPHRPAHITTVNIEPVEKSPQVPWGTAVYGDACALPAEIDPAAFDLVYSNSVIEHVGGHAMRERMAAGIRTAKHYWIQTPYRYFPVEPHFLFPGFQFLPAAGRARVSEHWSLGHKNGAGAGLESVLSVELLSKAELLHYFPDSELLVERFGGWPKSLVAVR